MAINKVVYNTENGAETLIDLTGDTVAEDTLAEGVTAHNSMGEVIIGTAKNEDIIKHADIPNYIKDAVFDVANKVEQVRKSDSIVFMAMSDSHHLGEQFFADNTTVKNINTSNYHACMAAKILSYLLKVDFNCHLGDITFGHSTTTEANLKQQIEEFNSYIDEAYGGVPQFRCVGNHDTGYYNTRVDADYLFNVIGKYCDSDDTEYGNTTYGYCYRDFEDKNLRVICLNSSESDMKGSTTTTAMSPAQLEWFAQTLYDVGSNDGWSVIVLSHFPLDFNYKSMYKAADIVKAYIGKNGVGESITINGTTIDFKGNNKAKFVANVHGHVHCFKVDKLHTITNSVGTKFDAWRVCVPTSNSNNSVQLKDDYAAYGIQWYEDTVYYKEIGTYKDTAFVINVVNPSDEVIYSFCYGAGPEEPRLISYGAATHYSISYDLTYTTSTETAIDIMENEPFTTTLTANDGYEISSVVVTMGGVDITASVYSNGAINIPIVMGNISITANAVKITSYTNQIPIAIDMDGSIYNGKGWKENTYISSETLGSKTGYETTGLIPIAQGDIVRFSGFSFDLSDAYCRMAFFKADKTYITSVKANGLVSVWGEGRVVIEDNNAVQITIPNTSAYSGVGLFRLCADDIDENSIITVNEIIE